MKIAIKNAGDKVDGDNHQRRCEHHGGTIHNRDKSRYSRHTAMRRIADAASMTSVAVCLVCASLPLRIDVRAPY
ncbi:hypothetical protein J6524_35575 [Bradyrhizobium sp. WSM 1738]|uniref:hypothetical protein n=1 Tax=Bradyrhizobium hereditatis TaxID=2821405 RepID=UPI001CE24184|nr:hypothetical protein [Bradyrhizobium hereditatis]MCA6120125.1 hypothetical protein [Bradyrhizobium hereditatis]